MICVIRVIRVLYRWGLCLKRGADPYMQSQPALKKKKIEDQTTILDLLSAILKLHAYGSPNGLDTISENLKLNLGSTVQVVPPSEEKNDWLKIGASFG